MKRMHVLSAAIAVTIGMAAAAAAQDIVIEDAYARSSTMMSKSGAAFMIIRNTGTEDDRLVAAASDISARVELHTHIDAGNGVMQMREDEDGFEVPAGGMHMLARGADHVMFMGLKAPMQQGDEIEVTLTFEKAGDITVTIPVDLERKPRHGGGMGHGAMGAGQSGSD
jgi:copper(I)-binding protein